MSLIELDFRRNYFDLFSIPRGFEVDMQVLNARYRELQSAYHPDRYVNAESRERRLAVQASAWVNEAYETVRDPTRRARYLLELEGQMFNDERDTTFDSDFLMRQITFRESLEGVGSASNPLVELDLLMEELRRERSQLYAHFQSAYEAGEFDEAKRTVLQMNFFARLIAEAGDMAEGLEDQNA